MQHAVHNRATIRVADRTDVSGRVTADEVNLDRFHNRIRKVCALVAATLIPSSLRWMLLFAVLIVPQVLWGAASAPATPQPPERRGSLPWELRVTTKDVRRWRFFLMKSGFMRATASPGRSTPTSSIR